MMKKLTSLVLVVVLALSLTACGASLTLDKAEHTFTSAGETVQLSAESKKALTWSSSDEAVATVDQNGLVTAVAPGTATITATVDEKTSATCKITCDWVAVVDLAAFYAETYDAVFPADAAGDPTGPYAEDLSLFPEMLDMNYPGLSEIETKQCLVYMPGMSAVAYEIALIEVADAADVDAVKAILQARIDTQVNGGAWYPETTAVWENNAQIVVNGNYIMLAVYENSDAFVDAFNAQF